MLPWECGKGGLPWNCLSSGTGPHEQALGGQALTLIVPELENIAHMRRNTCLNSQAGWMMARSRWWRRPGDWSTGCTRSAQSISQETTLSVYCVQSSTGWVSPLALTHSSSSTWASYAWCLITLSIQRWSSNCFRSCPPKESSTSQLGTCTARP